MGILPSLRWALVDWLVSHRSVDHIEVRRPVLLSSTTCPSQAGDEGSECWTVDEVLRALWDDRAAAPARVTALLGLPRDSDFGRIARVLQAARAETPEASWSETVWRVACGQECAEPPRRQVGGSQGRA